MGISVRHENTNDYTQIRNVYRKAFERDDEHTAVTLLRMYTKYITELSLVAEVDRRIVGHAVFFPVRINQDFKKYASLVLTPVGVLPEYFGEKVDEKIIEAGINIATDKGCTSILVIGDVNQYSKYGFDIASKWNIEVSLGGNEENFLCLEISRNGGLLGISGIVDYPKELIREK